MALSNPSLQRAGGPLPFACSLAQADAVLLHALQRWRAPLQDILSQRTSATEIRLVHPALPFKLPPISMIWPTCLPLRAPGRNLGAGQWARGVNSTLGPLQVQRQAQQRRPLGRHWAASHGRPRQLQLLGLRQRGALLQLQHWESLGGACPMVSPSPPPAMN